MDVDLKELTPEVREAIGPVDEQSLPPALLHGIGIALAKKRDEAKAARAASGIEQVWKDAEEAYVGIDDANRHEYAGANWAKPMTMDGPLEKEQPRRDPYKSTVCVNITARYVDAGSGKLAEILIPADDKAFSLTETPVPRLVEAQNDNSQVVHDGMGNIPLMRPLGPDDVPPPGTGAPGVSSPPPAPAATPAPGQGAVPNPGAGAGAPQPQMVPLTVADLAKEAVKLARDKAKKAEKRIYDWMTESQYPVHMRKLIFDAARIGSGCIKGPFPKPSKGMAVTKTDSGYKTSVSTQIIPAVEWNDVWNLFPDPTCGEDIHNGEFLFVRDYLSPLQVRDLMNHPGYIKSALQKVLDEGPDARAGGNSERPSLTRDQADSTKGRFEVWYFYGVMTKEEMDCIDQCTDGRRPRKDPYQAPPHVIATLINSTVVKGVLNPLDSGAFPYHVFPWQRRTGHWAGIGVAEQIKAPQKIVNAATRAMLNNAGKSAGSQIVVNNALITPADGNPVMTPDKIWNMNSDGPNDDVRKAFTMFEIPNVTKQMLEIIQYGLRLGEEQTSIPLITQGQTGPTTPDTFGAAQLQNNNANQLLRAIGYSFDGYITEPLVRDYYEWLLLDPDVPDDEKGDFTIKANGSVALVERAIQDQTIAQLGPLSLNPAYGLSPKKWMSLYLKSKHIDPTDAQYSEEEQKKIDATPPPAPPQIEVAKIRAGVDEKKIAAAAQTSQQNLQTETELRYTEMQDRRQLAMLEYANREKVSIDAIKAMLAKTTMTLNVQRELSDKSTANDRYKHDTPPAQPAAEPEGRAAPGKAFEQ